MTDENGQEMTHEQLVAECSRLQQIVNEQHDSLSSYESWVNRASEIVNTLTEKRDGWRRMSGRLAGEVRVANELNGRVDYREALEAYAKMENDAIAEATSEQS